MTRAKRQGRQGRQIPFVKKPRRDGERKISREAADSHCQEKLLSRKEVPVPQTDTGRQGENPKMSGRSVVKELGKNTP